MAKEIEGTREYLIGRNVYIYRPSMSPKMWWISYKLDNAKRRHESLKTKDRTHAIMIADNHYEKVRDRFKVLGSAAFKTKSTMRDCLNHFIKFKHQKEMVASERRAKQVIAHFERFIEYFGSELEITSYSPTKEQLSNYIFWRRGKAVDGRDGYKPASGKRPRLSKTTYNMEVNSLKQVWNRAKQDGVIEDYPAVPVEKISAKTTAAGSTVEFLPSEIPELIRNFEAWCVDPDELERKNNLSNSKDIKGNIRHLKSGYNSFHYICRERMYCFAMLLLATSTRPRTLAKITWGDIQENEVDGVKMYAFDFKHSKTNRPYVAVAWGFHLDVEAILSRWKKHSPTYKQKNNKGLRVFDVAYRVKQNQKSMSWVEWTRYSGVFKKFLEEYKMLKHPTDPKKRRKNRAIYSLRSTAITMRAKSGLPIATVADQANTSIAMIEKHYYQNETAGLMKTLSLLPSTDMSQGEVVSISKKPKQKRSSKKD